MVVSLVRSKAGLKADYWAYLMVAQTVLQMGVHLAGHWEHLKAAMLAARTVD